MKKKDYMICIRGSKNEKVNWNKISSIKQRNLTNEIYKTKAKNKRKKKQVLRRLVPQKKKKCF